MSESQKNVKPASASADKSKSPSQSQSKPKAQPHSTAPLPQKAQTLKSSEASSSQDAATVAIAAATGQKSKADLKRERREVQEAQRAKKATATAGAGAGGGGGKKPEQTSAQSKQQSQQPAQPQKATVEIKPNTAISQPAVQQASASQPSFVVSEDKSKKVQQEKTSQPPEKKMNVELPKLFHHFDQYSRDYSMIEKFAIDSPHVHPAFIKLGLQSAHERINGSNSRCLSFLNTFKAFLHDYRPPSSDKKPIPDDLEQKFKANINFLIQCRPLCISMGNAIKELKQIIAHMPKDISESDVKEMLNDEVDKFIHEKILLAAETINKYMLAHSDIVISGTSYAKSKITNDDCLMVYGNSSLVTHILLEASSRFPDMHVVVVDSRPKYKGKQTVEKLVKHGMKCTYVMINAISYVMNRVTKVLLGAHALLANNYVVSNIGTAQIALVAKSFNVPVVVCCETYKFCDKVQTDALVNNELGNPLDLVTSKSSTNYLTLSTNNNMNESTSTTTAEVTTADGASSNSTVTLLNLTYDVTPPDLITCVVTDMGMLPCTSVPVVLRLKNRDLASLSSSSASVAAARKHTSNEKTKAI